MTALWITLYVVAGIVVGAKAAWEEAKIEAQSSYPSQFMPLGAFLACGVCWPIAVAFMGLSSLGWALIRHARKPR